MNNISRVVLKLLLVIFFLTAFIPCSAICILGYLISFINEKVGYFLQSFVAYTLWSIFHCIFKLSCKMKDPDVPINNYLVISNHLSAADFMLINAVNKHMLAHNKYSFKRSLQFLIPIFYPWAKSSNQLVLTRNFEKDKNSIMNFVRTMTKNKLSAWIILYCEGTRFTAAKKNQSDAFCTSKGIEPFRNVLCPRHRGFNMLFDGLKGSQFKKILDLTFYSEEDGFSLCNVLFTSKIFHIDCDARIVDMTSVEHPENFLMETFRRKDNLIDSWKNNVKSRKEHSE